MLTIGKTRKLITLLILVAAIIGIAYLLLLQIWPAVSIRRIFPKDARPEAYAVPASREVGRRDFEGRRDFSYSGFKFEVPWTGLLEEVKRGQAVSLLFPQDKALAIFGRFEQPSLSLFLEFDPEGLAEQKIVDYYGEEILQRGYDFHELILNTSPEQISIFTPRKEALAKSALVIIKVAEVSSVISSGTEPKIYSFATGDIRGFQFGDPEVTGKAFISFFDAEDREYTLLIKGAQEEVDFILSSIEIPSQE